jgi:hypothetical protein
MSSQLYYLVIFSLFLCILTEETSINHFLTIPLNQVNHENFQHFPPSSTQVTPTILPIPFPKTNPASQDKSKTKIKRNPSWNNHNMSTNYFITPHNRFVVDKPSVAETEAVIHHLPYTMSLMQPPPDQQTNNLHPPGFHYESTEDEDRMSEESSPEGEDASHTKSKQVTTQPLSVAPGYATGSISDLQAFLRYRNNTGTPFRMESLTADQLKGTTGIGKLGSMSNSDSSTPLSDEQFVNQDHVEDILNRFKPLMNTSLSHPVKAVESTASDEEAPIPQFPPHFKTSPQPSFKKLSVSSTTPAASSTSSTSTSNLGSYDPRVTNMPPKTFNSMNKFKQSTPTYLNRAQTKIVATTVSPDQQFTSPDSQSNGQHLEQHLSQQGHRSNSKHTSRDKGGNDQGITRLPQDYPDDNLPPTSSYPHPIPAVKISSRPERTRLIMKSRDKSSQTEGKQIQVKQDPTESTSAPLLQDKSRQDVVFNDDQTPQSNFNPSKNNRGRGSSLRPNKYNTKSSTPNFSDSLYYTTDDAFMNKLTTAADTNKADHTSHSGSEDIGQDGDDHHHDHVPPSKEGTLNGNIVRQLGNHLGSGLKGDVIGGGYGDPHLGGIPAAGLGYGPGIGPHLHGHLHPPLFPHGPFSPALLLPPFLPPPPPGPITCCKRYFPQQSGLHHHGLPIMEGKSGGGLHGLHSNEIVHASNEVDTGPVSTTVVGASSSISKSETFASPVSGLELHDIKGGLPGIPGESFCYQEPVFPHPLYIKQLKLQKLLFPFWMKKKLIFG